jgi:DeoR family fructose operon transcriptional repressor
VSIANLCKIFNTTSVSIRNNLNRLEKVRLLKRTDGGAFHYKPPFLGLALSEKEKLQADEKKRFVKETVRLIFEGSTLQRTLPY